MDVEKRILDMDKYLIDTGMVDDDYVDSSHDLLITIHTKQDVYEPCMYVSETDMWLSIIDLSLGEGGQLMDIKKTEIVGYGLYNGYDIFSVPKQNNKSFYN